MKIFKSILPVLMAALIFFQVNAYEIKTDSIPDTAISLLICSPGSEIYELEGHAAMRIVHPIYGDVTVNWGLFDFNTPNFAYRFTKGETDYRAGATPTDLFVGLYQREGRTVTEIPVKLTPDEAKRVIDLVTENLRPENRVYRYNYLYDNCSTRPLAIIEKATGDSISLKLPDDIAEGETFRTLMSRYHQNYPWYQFGIDLALGNGIDKKVTPRDATFAPVILLNQISGQNDRFEQPVVLTSPVTTDGGPAGPTPLYLTPIFIGWIVFAIALILTVAGTRLKKVALWFDRVYYLAVALSGLLLTFLIFVSVHEATSPNWLYLWLNPLAFTVVIGIGTKRLVTLVLFYQLINFASLIALCIIAATGIQSLNAAFYPLILADLLRSANYIYRNKSCLSRKSY